MKSQKINRLKVVLVENKKAGKTSWQKLSKRFIMMFHNIQPSIDMLVKIAIILNINPRQLINGGNNN